jgi:hypothetical protein
MADQVNFTTYAMNAGGSPMPVTLPDGACRVIIKAVQGYVGVAQFGSGSWTPVAVASMSNSGYLGATMVAGDVLEFVTRAAQTPAADLYVASLEATNPSIASVTVIPE